MPSQLGIEPVIFVNGQERDDLRLVEAERSVGTDRLDYAVLDRDLGVSGDFLHDYDLSDQWSAGAQMVEVTVAGRTIHYGAICKSDITIGARLQQKLVSRLEKWHFGTRLRGYHIHSRTGAAGAGVEGLSPAEIRDLDPFAATAGTGIFRVSGDPVFNPIYEGHLVGNRSSRSRDGVPIFFDVRQSRSAAAIRYRRESNTVDPAIVTVLAGTDIGLTGQYWTLAEAVFYLCHALNADEKHVRNPQSIPELETILRDEFQGARTGKSRVLRNVRIHRGGYLTDYLTQLLSPFGFGFFVSYRTRGLRELRFYRSGSSSRQQAIGFQRRGEIVDPAKSPAASIAAQYDISGERTSNEAVVWGAAPVFETTFELIPAWEIDSPQRYTDYEQFGKATAGYAASPAIRRMHRDWVLNESGDYVGNTIPDTTQAGAPDTTVGSAFDINRHLKLTHACFAERRRVLLPTLTMDRSGLPIGRHAGGVQVDYWEPAENAWKDASAIAGGGKEIVLLRDECGIRFDGQFPPVRLFELGRQARVRVTASVQADTEMAGFYRNHDSPNPDRVGADLFQNQKWQFRKVDTASALLGAGPSTARDDTDAAAVEALSHVVAHNRATFRGTITLEGLDHGYDIGDVVSKIAGREIRFPLGPAGHLPQIVGMTYRTAAQQLTLTVDQFDAMPL